MDTAEKTAWISAAVSIGVGLLGVFGPHFRKRDQRLAIVDLATKRIAFWDQYFKVEQAAYDAGSNEERKVKADALSAIEKVRAEANQELARLSRRDALRQGTLSPADTFKGRTKFGWVCWMIGVWVSYMLFVVLIWSYVWQSHYHPLSLQESAVTSILLFISSIVVTVFMVFCQSMADQLKFPVPEPSLIAEI